eukprot:2453173-Rhodomonas_salina.6
MLLRCYATNSTESAICSGICYGYPRVSATDCAVLTGLCATQVRRMEREKAERESNMATLIKALEKELKVQKTCSEIKHERYNSTLKPNASVVRLYSEIKREWYDSTLKSNASDALIKALENERTAFNDRSETFVKSERERLRCAPAPTLRRTGGMGVSCACWELTARGWRAYQENKEKGRRLDRRLSQTSDTSSLPPSSGSFRSPPSGTPRCSGANPVQREAAEAVHPAARAKRVQLCAAKHVHNCVRTTCTAVLRHKCTSAAKDVHLPSLGADIGG